MRWFKKPGVQTVTFTARSKTEFDVQQKPYPASQAIPDWWRAMTPYDITPENPDGKKLIVRDRMANATFKKCTPMLDAITTGYIVPLWTDIQVTPSNDKEYSPFITWRTTNHVFQLHGQSSRQIPPPPGYDNWVYKYNNCWIPRTPPGYSVLVTSPFGHRDLPFYAIPAVIDSDKSTLEVIMPMWIRSGLEGIVEAGTPLVQITPFKRTDWKSEFDYLEDGKYYSVVEENNFNKTLVNHYIKRHWSKKTYK